MTFAVLAAYYSGDGYIVSLFYPQYIIHPYSFGQLDVLELVLNSARLIFVESSFGVKKHIITNTILQERLRQATAVGGTRARRRRPTTPSLGGKKLKNKRRASMGATDAASAAAAAAVVKAKQKRKLIAQQNRRKRSVEHMNASSTVPSSSMAVGEEVAGPNAAEGLNALISRRSEVTRIE